MENHGMPSTPKVLWNSTVSARIRRHVVFVLHMHFLGVWHRMWHVGAFGLSVFYACLPLWSGCIHDEGICHASHGSAL